MSNIELVKTMLAALRSDYDLAAKSPSRYVGNCNIRNYKVKFNVSDKDVQAYCDTFTMMEPVYPVCVRCGREWNHLEKKIEILGNGLNIEWVDNFTMWCGCDDVDGDSLWYYQNNLNRCSFDMEVLNLHDKYYLVRWNCNCMESECYGKNVITTHDDDNEDYRIIKSVKDLPLTISREDLYKLIEPNLSLL
jgi:hypothetical protein